MPIVKLLTPKRARKQDRRDNADYAVRQLNAIRQVIADFKQEGETDAVCVRRLVQSELKVWTKVSEHLRVAFNALNSEELNLMLGALHEKYGDDILTSALYTTLTDCYELAYEAESGGDDADFAIPIELYFGKKAEVENEIVIDGQKFPIIK